MSGSEDKQLKAKIITGDNNNKTEKTFKIDVQKDDNNDCHLNSLRNCVNRLQTQLNQYLTQIIDDENAGNSDGNQDNKTRDEDIDRQMRDESSRRTSDDRTRDEPKQKKCKNK